MKSVAQEQEHQAFMKATAVDPMIPDIPVTFTVPSADGGNNIVKGNSRMIIEAIDALRARKARPDEERISYWVHRK